MSAARHLESRLPEVLEELSSPRTPAYYDDILGQVARTRQRPGWTFPERWLPMTAISDRLATAPRVPMRMAVAVALLLLALTVSVLLIVGSQRPSVPAPFGLAGNGQIVFEDASGAIRVGNLADGSSKVIVSGSGVERPVFSPDGRRLAYLRRAEIGQTEIVVSGPMGESPRVLHSTKSGPFGHYGWMPDSQTVIAVVGNDLLAFDVAAGGEPKVLVMRSGDGSVGSFEFLDGFNNNLVDVFRPPNGDEILYVGAGPEGTGLYRQPLSGGDPITVITDRTADVPFVRVAGAQWSPDGTRIALTIHEPANPDNGRAWIVNADGTGLRRVSGLDLPPGYVIDEEHVSWSPDGARIAFGRWITVQGGNVNVRPVVIVDLATGRETELSNIEVNGYGGWAWAPDGTSIVQVPGDGSEHVGQVLVVDATTGEMREMGWAANPAGGPSWQRTVPAT
jgi:Tol biopolymer transport system component